MTARYDVAIVGGGVVGCAIAYYLSLAGVKVMVLEQRTIGGGASGAAAGMLPPWHELSAEPELLPFAVASWQMFPDLVLALQAETGIDLGYVQSGSLTPALSDDDAGALRNLVRTEQADGAPVQWLDAAGVRAAEPRLTPRVRGARFDPREHHLLPERLVQAFAAAAGRRGAELRSGALVTGLCTRGDRVEGVRLGGEDLPCEHVVIAAGAWSAMAEQWLGVPLPVRPVRGQMMALENGGLLHGLVWAQFGYLVAKPDGTIWAGATMDEIGFDTRVTPAGLAYLLGMAISTMPALKEAGLVRTWAGLRPGSGDGRPLLGPVPGWSGVSLAAGHLRNGILLSPITGKCLAEQITTGRSACDLRLFDPARFLSPKV